ncbi:MAG: hypothetical protein FJ191_08350 [Gammaproteobacteria bacterium]|nr:hypothetical protein [Gammaproteobacteria bacterium]
MQAVVWFCNARIRSTRGVEQRFAGAAGMKPDWDDGEFQTIPPEHLYAYVGGPPPPGMASHPHPGGDRGEARELITTAIGFDELTEVRRAELVRQLGLKVRQTMHVTPTVSMKARRVELELRPVWDGVQAIVYYVALLLLSVPQQRRRVGRCRLERCGTYFYDTRLRGGKQQLFCPESGTAHRVAHFREMHR